LKQAQPSYSVGFFLLHALRWLITGALLVLLGIATYIGIRFYHIDNQLYLWWHDTPRQVATMPQAGSLPLQSYRMDIDGRIVAGIERNLSGLAYDDDKNQLIAVINRPATLLTMDLEGRVLHRHRLRHASDIEGVAYLGNNRVALAAESDSRILIAALPPTADAELDLHDATSLTLDTKNERDNAGFEGLAYDRRHDWLYIGNEHSPRGLYRISGLGEHLRSGRMAIRVENLAHWLTDARIGTDLSSVEVNAGNGHLLLLSDESQRIVELDAGKVINQMELRALDSRAGMPLLEGVALAPDGTLFLVSEPNLFYRLKPASPAVAQ
jgi:uncharacterized protein YjiK